MTEQKSDKPLLLQNEVWNSCTSEYDYLVRVIDYVGSRAQNYLNCSEGKSSINSVENGWINVNMEGIRKIQDQIRQVTAGNSRLTVRINDFKV